METQAITNASTTAAAGPANTAASELGGDDFFKLLIAQLNNQDPLEPTSNQDLLNQISSIRDIELSSQLSNSLESLTEQQRFASSAGLIGRFVKGETEGDDAAAVSGTVTSIRFGQDGKAILELEGGQQLPIDRVSTVMDADRAAESLMGQFITGVNQEDPEDPRVVEGIATGRSTDSEGRVVIELDTGEEMLLSNVVASEQVVDLG